MSKFVVQGGNGIYGDVKISGAKNSVLPILAATVLLDDECIIDNCPEISDVLITIKILNELGCSARFENESVYINSKGFCRNEIPAELMHMLRSSVVFLGSILARSGEAKCSFPGGCAIGKRPINLHLKAFEEMGAEVDFDGTHIDVHKLKDKDSVVMLDFPSVGATENAMLYAALSDKNTVIVNAAAEPEIVDLQNFLNCTGANISGAGTKIIKVYGAKKLHGVRYKIIPDRIEAATFMSACAMSGGDVNIYNMNLAHTKSIADILSGCDAKISETDKFVNIKCEKRLKSYPFINTAPYPEFPTDAQSVLMAAMSTARGSCVIKENIFENRFKTAQELVKMGADIKIKGSLAYIKGQEKLRGARLFAPDLRGGAACVMAAIRAEGESIIENIEYIDRGYSNFEKKLENLGVRIKRTD